MEAKTSENSQSNVVSTILIVDDDPAVVRLISENLTREGYRVLAANDGIEALERFTQSRPNLIVLDLGIPRLDGWTVCERVRDVSAVPIIILSARGELDDVVRGLEMGADDYVLKPFKMRELIARIGATLRRASAEHIPPRTNLVYNDPLLSISLDERRVTIGNVPVHLTPTEYRLLAELLAVAPRVVPYRDLLERVWGREYIDDIDYLRVYIWHLRRKLEGDPKAPKYIINEHGVGYRFEQHLS